MSDGMGREFTYLSSHATNRYFIPNWGKIFCVFREICGSLIKAAWVKFIAEKKLPQNSQNSQKFIAEKKTPTEFTEYTEVYC